MGAWIAAGLAAAGVAWIVVSVAASAPLPEIVLLAVVAPIVEERLKALPSAFSARSTVGPTPPRVGALQGAAVGLGFAAGETGLLAVAARSEGLPWPVVAANVAARAVTERICLVLLHPSPFMLSLSVDRDENGERRGAEDGERWTLSQSSR